MSIFTDKGRWIYGCICVALGTGCYFLLRPPPDKCAPQTAPGGKVAVSTKFVPEQAKESWQPDDLTLSGQLSDRRPYTLAVQYGKTRDDRASLRRLDLSIDQRAISVPAEAWSDLRVVPVKSTFDVTDFAGIVRLAIVGQRGDRSGVATLSFLPDQVLEREFATGDQETVTTRYAQAAVDIVGSKKFQPPNPEAVLRESNIELTNP